MCCVLHGVQPVDEACEGPWQRNAANAAACHAVPAKNGAKGTAQTEEKGNIAGGTPASGTRSAGKAASGGSAHNKGADPCHCSMTRTSFVVRACVALPHQLCRDSRARFPPALVTLKDLLLRKLRAPAEPVADAT